MRSGEQNGVAPSTLKALFVESAYLIGCTFHPEGPNRGGHHFGRRTIHVRAAKRGGCSIQNGKSCGKSVPKRVFKLISNYFLQLPATVGMLIVGGRGCFGVGIPDQDGVAEEVP